MHSVEAATQVQLLLQSLYDIGKNKLWEYLLWLTYL